MSARNPMVRCHAKNRAGTQCGHWAMHGQGVCYLHGGKSPQALKKAEERFRDLVDPSITRLAKLIVVADNDSVSLGAIKYVLDYAGFKATEKIQADGRQIIEVEYVGRAPTLDVPHMNGHAARPPV